eukprot:m.55420 g.55420  ORF g.55420 m.55420 type:complete len:590 (-) comp13652_c0_seq1:80-1849(-)
MSEALQKTLAECKTEIEEKFKFFSKEYVSSYKNELVAQAIAEQEESQEGDEAPSKRLLLSPPEEDLVEDTTPIMTGSFTKRGGKVKNWKPRYFVVLPNHRVEYYESEAAYNSGAKPKGTMLLDGYKIVRDPNARKIAEKTKTNELLKLEAGEVTYEKYEPLTLEAYHETRRRWLFKFEDQATFDEWAKMLEKCSKMCKSGLLKEETAIAAFDAAFLETKRVCWPWTYRSYGGSEADQLIALFTEHCRRRFLWHAEFPGTGALKKAAYSKAVSAVRASASAIVGVGWKVVSSACDASRETVLETLKKGLGPVVTARSELVGKAVEQLSDKIQPIKEKLLLPLAKILCQAVGAVLSKSIAATKPVYKKETETYVDQVGKGEDAGKKRAVVIQSCYRSMYPALKTMDQAEMALAKIVTKMPESLTSSLGELMDTLMDVVDPITWIEETKEALRLLSRSAGYTFTEEVGTDASKVQEDAATVDASIEAKFDNDAKLVLRERMSALSGTVLSNIIKTQLLEPLTAITETLDGLIPEAVQELISANGIIESVVDGVIDEVAEEAAAAVVPEEGDDEAEAAVAEEAQPAGAEEPSA